MQEQQNYAPQPPAGLAPESLVPKQRRVGTFTLGLLLIMIGVMIPCVMIWKEKALTIIQFAPAILIVLGVEVLVYAFRYREGKLKYDWAAIWLVFLLTIGVGAASIFSPFVQRWKTLEQQTYGERIALQETAEEALLNQGGLGDVHVSPTDSFTHYGFDAEETPYAYGLSITVTDIGTENAPTQEEAADFASRLVQEIASKSQEKLRWLSLEIDSDDAAEYSLSMNGTEIRRADASLIGRMLVVENTVENTEE